MWCAVILPLVSLQEVHVVMRLYCLYDRVAEECGNVFEQKNNALALRLFDRYLKDHPAINPDDYQLLFLGTFDRELGVIEAVPDSEEVFSGALDLADEVVS